MVNWTKAGSTADEMQRNKQNASDSAQDQDDGAQTEGGAAVVIIPD